MSSTENPVKDSDGAETTTPLTAIGRSVRLTTRIVVFALGVFLFLVAFGFGAMAFILGYSSYGGWRKPGTHIFNETVYLGSFDYELTLSTPAAIALFLTISLLLLGSSLWLCFSAFKSHPTKIEK